MTNDMSNMVGDIEWYGPRKGKGSVEDHVSHMDGVRRELFLKANAIASAAWVTLQEHRDTGASYIEVIHSPPNKLDSYILLKDANPKEDTRSAASIEFGHATKGDKLVGGLHVLKGAMDAAVRRYGKKK